MEIVHLSPKENELIISESDQFILENNTDRKKDLTSKPFNEAQTLIIIRL